MNSVSHPGLQPDFQPDLQPHEPLNRLSGGDNLTFLAVCCAAFVLAVVMILGAGG